MRYEDQDKVKLDQRIQKAIQMTHPNEDHLYLAGEDGFMVRSTWNLPGHWVTTANDVWVATTSSPNATTMPKSLRKRLIEQLTAQFGAVLHPPQSYAADRNQTRGNDVWWSYEELWFRDKWPCVLPCLESRTRNTVWKVTHPKYYLARK